MIRFQVLQGNRVHYMPGWDCHGLPIELKALKADQVDSLPGHSNTSMQRPLEVRAAARALAEHYVHKQRSAFSSWGTLADWQHCYRTMDPEYINRQLDAFYDLFQKGLVYRHVLPVYWSPSAMCDFHFFIFSYFRLFSVTLKLHFVHTSINKYV